MSDYDKLAAKINTVLKPLEKYGFTGYQAARQLQDLTVANKLVGTTSQSAMEELDAASESIANVNEQAGKSQNLKKWAATLKDNTSSVKDKKKAMEELGKQYPQLAGDMAGLIKAAEAEAGKIDLSNAATIETLKGNLNVLAQTVAAKAKAAMLAGETGAYEGYQQVAAYIKTLLDLIDKIGTGVDAPTPHGGGGGGGKTNKALQAQQDELNHQKAMDQLSLAEEEAWLEKMLTKYAKTAKEKQDIEEKLYAVRKEKMQADLEYQKAMDQLTLQEEIDAITKEISKYKEGTQARKDLEKELYQLKKDLAKQEYDLQVYYGQLTLEQQVEKLQQMISQYKAGTQERIDLEKQLYDVQQQIKERDAANIDKLSDGLVDALKARYDEQKRIEEERIKTSIDAWKKWGDEQVAAIDTQIKALDELTKGEDRAEEERKRRRQIAALEQQLQYENDAYNRRKLQDQLTQAQDDLNKWLARNEREDLKASLQDQADAARQKVQDEQDKLNQDLDANSKYYDDLTQEYKLRAEAEKMLMQGSQQEIVDLIKAFVPEYDAIGKSMGEKLVDGFKSRVGDIEAWFQSLNASIVQYQNQMAAVANAAADAFWLNRGAAPAGTQTSTPASSPTISTLPQVTMIFNGPVDDPIEFRRQVQAILEEMYDM